MTDCAKTATAEELDLEEDELEGENIIASLVYLAHMRELRVANFQASLVVKLQDSVATSAVLCEAGNSFTNNTVA